MKAGIKQILQKVLFGTAGPGQSGILDIQPVGGGSINDTYQVSTKDNKRWFCKFNDTDRFPDLFLKESRGLSLLGRPLSSQPALPHQAPFRIPATIICTANGHRSIDLAMTTLFGGFEQPFYEAYKWYYPFPANYRLQWEIANLYLLLIHLNLFGKSYLSGILHTIQGF